ncbi:hypothetical protein GCM10009087_37350 [Sphingomonas oligophenolica]|uniref:Uncharacterized protein n=1 Tax=Sphingomonas oligophenolica TaxID=301154 RepID=A0ABU9YA77_9SPHN
MKQNDDFISMIPELPAWNNGAGIAPEEWIACVGNYQLAVGYSLIFWPRFVLFEGYLLREGFSEESLRGFEEVTNGNRVAVEAVMNHVHMIDIHCNDVEANEAQLRYLGRLLKDIYTLKLKADFPGLNVTVAFNDEPGLDLLDYELVFFQSAD